MVAITFALFVFLNPVSAALSLTSTLTAAIAPRLMR